MAYQKIRNLYQCQDILLFKARLREALQETA